MRQEREELPSYQILDGLAACGHYLHFRMGEKAGRRRIFSVLLERGELPQKELQEILGICSGSLSEILAKTEADGFIEKIKSKTDGRQMNLRMTQEGVLQAQEVTAAYDQKVQQLLSCFSKDQQERFLSMLKALVDHWNTLEPNAILLPPKHDKRPIGEINNE